MAGEDSGAEDRTEAATPKRLEQARESGQLPVSRDLTMLAMLGGAILGAVGLMPPLIHRLASQSANLLANFSTIRIEGGIAPGGLVSGVLVSAAMVIASVALPAAACSMGGVLLQTNFYVGGAPIRFQFSRINPGAGLARILSWHSLLDFLKACGRLGLLLTLVWSVLWHDPGKSIASIGSDVGRILSSAWDEVEQIVRPLLVILACFAVVDVFLVRLQHMRRMRMTREQIRLEMRDADGDPFIKNKMRRIQQQRSKRRMMAKVKTADVIVTNPTHYAIALTYERGGSHAPRVVAKGIDFVAARIREEAALHGVPLVPNVALARALYQVELDQEIPGEHFRAVAEIIAFVWKLKQRNGLGMVRP